MWENSSIKRKIKSLPQKISRMITFIPIRWHRFVGLAVDIDGIHELATVIFHKCVNNPNHILKEKTYNDKRLFSCNIELFWLMIYKYNRKFLILLVALFNPSGMKKSFDTPIIYIISDVKRKQTVYDLLLIFANYK